MRRRDAGDHPADSGRGDVLVRRHGVARASGDADQRVFVGHHGRRRGDEFAGDAADCEGESGGKRSAQVSGNNRRAERCDQSEGVASASQLVEQ